MNSIILTYSVKIITNLKLIMICLQFRLEINISFAQFYHSYGRFGIVCYCFIKFKDTIISRNLRLLQYLYYYNFWEQLPFKKFIIQNLMNIDVWTKIVTFELFGIVAFSATLILVYV